MAVKKRNVKKSIKSRKLLRKKEILRNLSIVLLFVTLPGLILSLVLSRSGNSGADAYQEVAPFSLDLSDNEALESDLSADGAGDDDGVDEPPPFVATHHPDFINTAYTKAMILNDIDDRVSPEFDIPKELLDRVGFWFDAYTKHSSNDKVIHHTDYPWLVFEAIDTSRFYIAQRATWRSAQVADAFVKKRKKLIERTLNKLSKMNSRQLKKLNDFENSILELVKTLPGSLRRNLRQSAKSLRVQLGQKNFIHLGLTRSRPYLESMEEIFASHGMPTELTRLPFVESSFNVRAISKVGASGIWQFMPSIGRKFLKVSSDIDERNSPLKATVAAAKLLKQNYRILGSWELALTAYNHGPGGVRKASQKVRSKELHKIIKGYSSRSFSFASKNFYCEFLAALYAEKYHEEIFGAVPSHFHEHIVSLKLDRTLRPKQVASLVGLDLEQLIEYNYDLKKAVQRNSRIPRGLEVFFPKKELSENQESPQEGPSSPPELGKSEDKAPNAS